MSLITPDFGLLFWMTVIFAIVFFILAKFGFPVLTDMVRKRQERIDRSIESAREIEQRLSNLAAEEERSLAEARKVISQHKDVSDKEAREEARAQTEKMISEAKVQIAAEKESALRDVRKEVALLSVQVAEKVLRREMEGSEEQNAFIDKMVEEASQASLKS